MVKITVYILLYGEHFASAHCGPMIYNYYLSLISHCAICFMQVYEISSLRTTLQSSYY